MIETLQQLGYEVTWAQGPTPEELREAQRMSGWAWEGDTEVRHHVHVTHRVISADESEPLEGPVPLQTTDPQGPGYVPEHMILRDDSNDPLIVAIVGFGVNGIFPADDEETLQHIIDTHEERKAFLEREEELQAGETPEETAERQERELEERVAELQASLEEE